MQVVDCDFLQFTHACLAAALVAFGIPGAVFWPYFAGTALLAIGLPIIIKNELPQAHGLEKILPFGHLFFTIPMVVFAAQHFTSAKFVVLLVPSWIPAHLFWVLLVGSALIAAALSIVVKRHAQLAATLLGIMFLLFEVLLHIPKVVANPRDRFAWAVALRDLSFRLRWSANEGTAHRRRAGARNPRALLRCDTRSILRRGALFTSRVRARRSPQQTYANLDSDAPFLGLFCGRSPCCCRSKPHRQGTSTLSSNLFGCHDSSFSAVHLPAHRCRRSLRHRQRVELSCRYFGLQRSCFGFGGRFAERRSSSRMRRLAPSKLQPCELQRRLLSIILIL